MVDIRIRSGSTSPISPIKRGRTELLEKIIKETAKFYGIKADAIVGLSRRRSITRPRYIAIYLAHQIYGFSSPEIGRAMGRDHSTIVNAYQIVARRIKEDPKIGEDIQALISFIGEYRSGPEFILPHAERERIEHGIGSGPNVSGGETLSHPNSFFHEPPNFIDGEEVRAGIPIHIRKQAPSPEKVTLPSTTKPFRPRTGLAQKPLISGPEYVLPISEREDLEHGLGSGPNISSGEILSLHYSI